MHLDGDNLVPYLTGQATKSPRKSFFYINDDQQLTGLRYDNWKLVFLEQQRRERCWFGPIRSRTCGFPKCSTFGRTRTSVPTSPRTPITTGCSITSTCSSQRRITWVSDELATTRLHMARRNSTEISVVIFDVFNSLEF